MKKNIALLVGGNTSEYANSLQIAADLVNNIDTNQYNVYNVIITKDGWWHETSAMQKVPVDKNDFSIAENGSVIHFDAAFIAMNGTPGEDGRMQGYFDMLKLPYNTCNAIISALTFNKRHCNLVVKTFNIVNIANSVHITKGESYSLGNILEELKMPLFVKPNESGSSMGASKVKYVEELLPAIEKAFKEDSQVLIEEFIEGRELTVGVYRINNVLYTLPVTEIRYKNDSSDYEEKYNSNLADEITPATLDGAIKEQLLFIATHIYRHLSCRGIVFIDFILQKGTDKLFFLEINTIPIQTKNSILSNQISAAGKTMKELYTAVLEDCLK